LQRYADRPSQERRRIQRDAVCALRGNVLRTEFYALDGTEREDRPYAVTEFAYGLREEDAPTGPTARRHVFFPHLLAQRATQWEPGDDPMTSIAYSRDYDAFGMALTQMQVACPRGWRRPTDAMNDATYLATVNRSTKAAPATSEVYIHDRVA